jgi:hypothetical protein
MASQSLEALFLRTRDQTAATGRRAHRAVLALALVHVLVVTPWVERERARSSGEAEEQRFGELTDVAALGTALQDATERTRSALEPQLAQLVDGLEDALDRLGETVDRLAAEAAAEAALEGGDEGPPLAVAAPLPFEIADPERLAAIRDAVAEGAPGSPGTRYGLLAALDPVVEEQIARPGFAEIQRAWEQDALPEVENRLGAAASALPGLRLRFPEAKDEWSAFEGALSGLRAGVRQLEIVPPSEPFWWASPETARALEIGLPAATAEKIRHPLVLDEILAAAEQARSRYEDLAGRLEAERDESLAATQARDRREQSFAGLLADLGFDLGAAVVLFPLLLGLVLAAVVARRSQRLHELGTATRLTIEEGGPLALRDWCLAQLSGRLSDERTADEAWRGGRLRALGVLAAAFAWIAVAALQVRGLEGVDETRWLIVTLVGAAAVLAATVHRLVIARGVVRLFVAGASESVERSFDETPPAPREIEAEGSDGVLDAHTLR